MPLTPTSTDSGDPSVDPAPNINPVPEAPPPDTPGGDTDNRPTSIFAGIGDCVVDELVGLWELFNFLLELNQDFDIAADGVDNYAIFQSLIYDVYRTLDLYGDLEEGLQQFGDLPNEQQLALQRLFAKQALIRDELEKAMDQGIDIIAAIDLYVIDTENERLIPTVPRFALKAITEVMAILYDDDEWVMRAARGLDFVNQMIETIRVETEARPWYVSGYVMCIIATMIIPIGAVTKAIRALRPLIAVLDGAPNAQAIRQALRTRGLNMPEHLGGTQDATPGNTLDSEIIPDVESPGPVVTPDDRPRSAVDTDNDAQRPQDPEEQEADPVDPETTNIPRSQRIGNLAEADARARLDREGFDTFELRNGSGHGPDIIAVHRETGAIRVIEVKANSSRLNSLQEQGGSAYLQNVFGRIDRLPDGGSWNVDEFADFLEDVGIENRSDLLRGEFEVWHYDGVDPDVPSSVDAGPNRTNWTPGTTRTEFTLDAQGQVLTRSGESRQWVPYEEPPEYSN